MEGQKISFRKRKATYIVTMLAAFGLLLVACGNNVDEEFAGGTNQDDSSFNVAAAENLGAQVAAGVSVDLSQPQIFNSNNGWTVAYTAQEWWGDHIS